MVDMVVKRHDIPETLARLLKILTKKPVSAANDMNGGAIALAASA
jgi:acetyl-CoA carboxylase carboxyl transferase subunit beta